MLRRVGILYLAFLFVGMAGCDSQSSAGIGAGGPPAAQSVDGFIEGELDGEARKWHITSGEMNGTYFSQSSWESFAGMSELKLFGHARADTLSDSQEALMVIITASSADASADVYDAEVVYLSGGLAQGYGSNEEGGFARLVLDSIENDGNAVRLSGHFESRMAFRALSGGGEQPAQSMLTLEGGRFEATVRQAD